MTHKEAMIHATWLICEKIFKGEYNHILPLLGGHTIESAIQHQFDLLSKELSKPYDQLLLDRDSPNR